ncbi:hypothetical protein L3X38_034862 [Prunus dulcis]|uniref:Uncharacterized protein n=1 Tax=Prunus dulcis TaxID=3755 RepID=A0AAD4VIV0_PRUDU|nr:hypothetical protein L3X38_034862 [Prunus dulcis]
MYTAVFYCPLIVTRPDPVTRSHSLLLQLFFSSELEHLGTRQHSRELQRGVSLPRPLCSFSPAASFSSSPLIYSQSGSGLAVISDNRAFET